MQLERSHLLSIAHEAVSLQMQISAVAQLDEAQEVEAEQSPNLKKESSFFRAASGRTEDEKAALKTRRRLLVISVNEIR